MLLCENQYLIVFILKNKKIHKMAGKKQATLHYLKVRVSCYFLESQRLFSRKSFYK
ncbi:hypothetical protein BDD26_1588 [Xenorhabdus cabanillasii]|uniref:Uncharacterized protein n=1 Tax=Xenorhabdus cabanillasii TaxID=351673 RepID=A0A3D9UQB5_9GAMM|nr:hypothetical protein BDD26_1588 [Xenorhabdus cabanillasii]